jgi:hypothetical protein
MFYLSARNSENKRRKEPKRLGSVQPKLSSVWHTGLSGGAPNSVWCARLASGEHATLEKNRRRTTIIHRTVRWCTGLSGEPTVASAMVGRAIRGPRAGDAWPAPTVGRGHRTVSVEPSGPELQRSSVPEKEGDRHRTVYSDCPVAHRTVRCATRQKARMAFLVGLQWLLAALGL